MFKNEFFCRLENIVIYVRFGMKISERVLKNGLIVLAIIGVVSVCIITAVVISMNRGYQIVEAPKEIGDEKEGLSEGTIKEESNSDDVEEIPSVSETEQIDVPEGLDLSRFVKQAYELKNLLAVKSFSSVEDLSVNQVVQYAFCYLYSEGKCLVDYKPSSMLYRQATEDEIKEQIVILFGSCPFEVTESDLYAPGKQYFEMWQPDYSSSVFSSVTLHKESEESFRIEISYFEDAAKTKNTDVITVTVKKGENNGFYLASMT